MKKYNENYIQVLGDEDLNKKFISALIAMAVTISFVPATVHADAASDNAKIQQVQAQRNNIEDKLTVMDNQIQTLMSDINDNQNSIDKTQSQAKQTKKDIAKAENDIQGEQTLFYERIRAMYINGSSASYIDVILNAKGLDDFISRVEDIKRILTYNKGIINDYETKKTAIDLKEATLNAENAKLVSLKTDNENKLADMNKQESNETVLVAQLNAQEKQYGAQLASDQATTEAAALAVSRAADLATSRVAVTTSKAATTKNVAEASSGSTSQASNSPRISRGGASFSASALIAYASNFIGVPYLWGGTTPAGFDCSGFSQYVFAHFGINLPRVADGQQQVGTYVDRADLQPGDLVFFGNPAHHVGIYVGNGNMINAPCTGEDIQIDPLFSDFSYGRSIIN